VSRAFALALVLAVAACGQGADEGKPAAPAFNSGAPSGLCALAPVERVADALGAEVTKTVGETPGVEVCVWYAERARGGLRAMRLERWRGQDVIDAGADVSLGAFYEQRVEAMTRTGKRVAALPDLGLDAQMGLSPHGEAGFDGEILVRRDGEALILSAEGEDPEAFEAVARALAGG
jgi:hypothetical protein